MRAPWLPLLAVALAACEPAPDAPPSPARVQSPGEWPVGTVLAVDDAPISIDEIDEASVWIQRIDPKAAGPQLRRLALTNVVLPRVLGTLIAPEERERARGQAEAQLARLEHGEVSGPPHADGGLGEVVEGNWQLLGVSLWGQAIDWQPDEWRLIEEAGRFVVARRLARIDQPHPTALIVRVDTFLYPYLPGLPGELESAIDEHRLTIVDPAWRKIVPERTQYRMGVHAP